MTTVDFDGLLTFHGERPSGAGWFYTDLADWYSTSASKSPTNERPQADGAFGIGQDFRPGQTLSTKCVYVGGSHADVQAAKHTLARTLDVGRPVRMTVTDVDGPTSRMVSIRSVPKDDDHGGNVLTFIVNAFAPDPNRYGPEIAQVTGAPVSGGGLVWPLGSSSTYWDWGADGSSGRLTVTNFGDKLTWPTLDVTGGVGGGFIITDATLARSVRLDRIVNVGSVVSLNQRTGRASINGQSDVSGMLTVRDFFPIGPGESHIIQFSPLGSATGTPQLTVRTAPAY